MAKIYQFRQRGVLHNFDFGPEAESDIKMMAKALGIKMTSEELDSKVVAQVLRKAFGFAKFAVNEMLDGSRLVVENERRGLRKEVEQI